MIFPAQIRGVRPRPWKRKDGSTVYACTFVVLDMSPRPVMDTFEVELEYGSEAELAKAATYQGKQCEVVCEGFKVGKDGEARFSGKIESVKQ
jgi:hypothetical protein